MFEHLFCCKTSLSRLFRQGACVKVMCLWPFPHINSETSQSLAADWWGETVLVWKHFQLILRRSHFYNWFKGLWMCARSVWNRQCSFFICNCFWRRLLVRDGLGLYQGLSCVFIAETQLFAVFLLFWRTNLALRRELTDVKQLSFSWLILISAKLQIWLFVSFHDDETE